MKTYIILGNPNYNNFLDNQEVVTNIEEADIVIFTGGADVTPSIYDEEKHITSMVNIPRDKKEIIEFEIARSLNKPMLGICRGSQLLTALSGGKLVQNVRGQPYQHSIVDTELDSVYKVTSTHHQMMFPFNLPEEDYQLIGYTQGLTTTWEGLPEGYGIPEVEPEIVYYNKTNCLCVQGHPEYPDATEEFRAAVNEHVNNFLLN